MLFLLAVVLVSTTSLSWRCSHSKRLLGGTQQLLCEGRPRRTDHQQHVLLNRAISSILLASQSVEIIVEKEIQVYSTLGCKYCRIAKAKLDELSLPYRNIDINDPPTDLVRVMNERLQHARRSTVPQIYFGGTLIGGCSDFLQVIEKGELPRKLMGTGLVLPLQDNKRTVKEEKEDAEVCGDNCIVPLPGDALNDPMFCTGKKPSANVSLVELSKMLHKSVLTLTDRYAIAGGSLVNYRAARFSKELSYYICLSADLTTRNVQEFMRLTSPERIAFFCNLYNAMVIHAKCIFPGELDASDRSSFFNGAMGVKYVIHGVEYSLDDIEHGILRGNKPHPSQVNQTTYFNATDVRALLSVPVADFDPRVHFVLNCGAQSCPPIKILEEHNLPLALKGAAEAYLTSEVSVDIDSKIIILPRLLLWYGIDFGLILSERIRHVANMLPHDNAVKEKLRRILESIESEDSESVNGYRIRYSEYIWTSNDSRYNSSPLVQS